MLRDLHAGRPKGRFCMLWSSCLELREQATGVPSADIRADAQETNIRKIRPKTGTGQLHEPLFQEILNPIDIYVQTNRQGCLSGNETPDPARFD